MQYTYTNTDGITEDVARERWGWEVEYVDGSKLAQFGEDGIFHRMDEIQAYRVKNWSLVHVLGGSKRIDFILPGGAKLIHGYRQRASKTLSGSGETTEETKITVYKFGIEVDGQKHLSYVLPDDRIVQATRELTRLI